MVASEASYVASKAAGIPDGFRTVSALRVGPCDTTPYVERDSGEVIGLAVLEVAPERVVMRSTYSIGAARSPLTKPGVATFGVKFTADPTSELRPAFTKCGVIDPLPRGRQSSEPWRCVGTSRVEAHHRGGDLDISTAAVGARVPLAGNR